MQLSSLCKQSDNCSAQFTNETFARAADQKQVQELYYVGVDGWQERADVILDHGFADVGKTFAPPCSVGVFLLLANGLAHEVILLQTSK